MPNSKYKPFRLNPTEIDYILSDTFDKLLICFAPFIQAESLYALALCETARELNMKLKVDVPRFPELTHDLIECSVCHRLIESPNIEECEFCNEDVCDSCWVNHQCEQEFASYE